MERKNKTIQDVSSEFCTGCGACYSICPHKAIEMNYSREGFLEPKINKEKCTNCSICYNICPAINTKHENNKKPLTFAVKAMDKIRKDSTSGGVFAVLADYVLSQNGYVCGAAFNENFKVSHIITNDKNELSKIKKSKYVQSEAHVIYKKIKELLLNGEKVLFSGCPCQVAGLNSYLQKKYDNLYTVDIICHGVPSPLNWEKYLMENFDLSKIKTIDFRHKGNHGFKKNYMQIVYTNNKEVIEGSSENYYYKHFKNLGLRKSCYLCKFSIIPRQGDFSIGDFWGAKIHYKDLIDNDKGLSLLLLNNKRSEDLFSLFKDNFELLKEINTKEAFAGNRKNYVLPENINRDRFFKMVQYMKFNDAVEKNLTKKYDVAICGATVGLNYGGLITYYALYKAVENMGYSVIMINSPKKDEIIEETHAERFCRENVILSEKKSLKDYYEYNNLAETFLLGSDQVWNYTLFPGRKENFYLDFIKDNKKKVSYASSFGFDKPTIFPNYEEKYPKISSLLKRFDSVSVREIDGVKICDNYFDVSSKHVLDPVFLLNSNEYEKIAEKALNKPKGKYIAIYSLTPKKDINEAYIFTAKKLDLPRVNMASGNPKKYEKKKKDFDMPYCENLQIEEWLYNIKNSEIVLTDSYHCVCFSIIFKKDFILIQNKWAVSRINSLLTKLNLLDRWVGSSSELIKNPSLLYKKIDYDKVYSILQKEIFESSTWLNNALLSSKKIEVLKDITINQFEKNIYSPIYNAKNLNEYFKAYDNFKNEIIIMISIKGKAFENLDKVTFFKNSDIGNLSKSKMDKGFTYICDYEQSYKRKKFGSYVKDTYYFKNTKFNVVSQENILNSSDAISEFYFEKNNKRKIYVCKENGMNVLIYSKLTGNIIDFINVDIENDIELKINRYKTN